MKIDRHLMVAGSAWASRAITALVQIASIRILTSTLGLNEYAAFALMSALVGWFLLADFGIGLAVQNLISEARAAGDDYHSWIGLASAVGLCLLLIELLLLWATTPILAEALFQRTVLTAQSSQQLFFCTGAIFLIATTGTLAYKIWYAEHRGYLANIMAGMAALAGYVGILWVSNSGVENKLLWSIVAFNLPTALFPLVALIRLLGYSFRPGTIPRGAYWKALLRSAKFWSFGLLAALVLQVDYLVISQTLDATNLSTYNIASRLFGFVFFLFNAMLLALWPVFAEALAKANHDFVRQKLRRYVLLGVLMVAVATLAFAVLMPQITALLSPKETIVVPLALIVSMGCYFTIRVWTDSHAMALQSMSALKPLMVMVPVQALLSVGLQVLLAPRLGLVGITLGLSLSYLLTVSWSLPYALRRRLNAPPASMPHAA